MPMYGLKHLARTYKDKS